MKIKILFILLILFLSSCSYFRVIPASDYSLQSIKHLADTGKFLVLHRGGEAWHAYDLQIKEGILQAKLDLQLGYLVKYLFPKEKKLNKFERKTEPEVLNSVHIYTSDTTFSQFDTLVTIPVSSIISVKTYEYAQASSRASLIVPLVVFPAIGTAILIAIIIKSINWDMDLHI